MSFDHRNDATNRVGKIRKNFSIRLKLNLKRLHLFNKVAPSIRELMNTVSKISLFVATLSFILSGCNPQHARTARITIRSTTQPNSAVKISVVRTLDKTSLFETTTDSVGNCSFEMTLRTPTIALIQIGKKYGEVYLAPGYALLIKENGQDYKIPLTFSGEGADVNNYISWVNSNVEKIKWASGKGLYDLDIKAFRHRFDSLKTTIDNFHEEYLDTVALADNKVSMLEYKNSIKLSAVQQEFKFYKLNDLNNRRWQAHKNGEEYLGGDVLRELTKLADDLHFDTTLLVGAYGDYAELLNFYWRNNVYLPIAGELIGSVQPEKRIPLLTSSRIKKGDWPDALRENLLAFDVMFWLGANGITPETDSIFDDFKATYPQSGCLPALNRTYDEFLALAPGKPAPEFEGLTQTGEMVSIKKLRGKVVYVDVWATWCAPCVAEIPSSIKLQRKLANEDGIRFLNVSVNTNKSDWEKFVKKNNRWTGIHIIIEPEKIDSLYKAYKLSGIPAYILIDQAGNIVDLKAMRPSDEELEMEVRKLLAG